MHLFFENKYTVITVIKLIIMDKLQQFQVIL